MKIPNTFNTFTLRRQYTAALGGRQVDSCHQPGIREPGEEALLPFLPSGVRKL